MFYILYGTQTGNAQRVAESIAEMLDQNEIDHQIFDMSEFEPEQFLQISKLIIVTSTYGDGEPPDNAYECYEWLKFNQEDLSHMHYAVLGLGDTYYPHFCQCGKDFDEFLSNGAAKSLIERMDCDLYFEETFPAWGEKLIQAILSLNK